MVSVWVQVVVSDLVLIGLNLLVFLMALVLGFDLLLRWIRT